MPRADTLSGLNLWLYYSFTKRYTSFHEVICSTGAGVDVTCNQWQKTSQFKDSCKDSKKLPVSWVYKTAKIFQGPAICTAMTCWCPYNASKFLRDTFYYVSYSVSDKRFQHYLIPCGQRLSFSNVFTMTIEGSCCFLLMNHKAIGLLLIRLTMHSCLWIVTVYFWVVILLLNYPDTVQVTPKRRNAIRYGYWKVHIVQIWHETDSLAVLPTFFHRINCHSPQPNVTYMIV
jgi:hypothetical protein